MKLRAAKRKFWEQFRFDFKNRTCWTYAKFNMPGIGHFWSGNCFKSGSVMRRI